jgi:hypothetical protein
MIDLAHTTIIARFQRRMSVLLSNRSKIRLPTPLLFGFFLVALLPVVARGQSIHVLMVSDTADENVGKACEITIKKVTGAFRELVPQDRYSLTIMDSRKRQYNSQAVLDAIKKIHVVANDTFVFLYDGHGANEDKRHFLQMPDDGRLWSDDLQKAVQNKSCKLQIILSGSCNVPARAFPRAPKYIPWNPKTQGIAPVMDELFINHTGLMHMNGAWTGQVAFTDEASGNWFFDELFSYCIFCPTGRPTWRSMDRLLDQRLKSRFRSIFEEKFVDTDTGFTQTSLYPITWSLPKNTNSQKTRFGVVGNDGNMSMGVKVTDIYADSPGKNITIFDRGQQRSGSLQKGDIILSISDEEIKGIDSYVDLVRLSSKNMFFTFKRNGKDYNAEATLNW